MKPGDSTGPVVASLDADWLRPAWSRAEIGATMTTRAGGESPAPWASLNLGDHVGDDASRVHANRARFRDAIGAEPVFLQQVHGTRVVTLDRAATESPVAQADASVTRVPGLACTILVADCLPVLFAAPGRSGVGAAHAGWRGLAGGVLEATLDALCEMACCGPCDVDAWIGVGIGPQRFEIGAEVVTALGGDPGDRAAQAFRPVAAATPTSTAPVARATWCADLPFLARARLQAAGVRSIDTATGCTASEPSRFFSYRRDGVTGRMAAAVWIR